MEKENRSGDFTSATLGFSRRDATPQTQDTCKSSFVGEHLMTGKALNQKASVSGDLGFGGISTATAKN